MVWTSHCLLDADWCCMIDVSKFAKAAESFKANGLSRYEMESETLSRRVIGKRGDATHGWFGFSVAVLVSCAVIALDVVSLSTNGFEPAIPTYNLASTSTELYETSNHAPRRCNLLDGASVCTGDSTYCRKTTGPTVPCNNCPWGNYTNGGTDCSMELVGSEGECNCRLNPRATDCTSNTDICSTASSTAYCEITIGGGLGRITRKCNTCQSDGLPISCNMETKLCECTM